MFEFEVEFPDYTLRLRSGTMEKVSEAVARGLDRQAAAGLGPGRKVARVTLHGGHLAEIWKRVSADDQGNLRFDHALAYLIEQYGAGDLKPAFLEEVEREVEPILEAGIDAVEE